MDDTKAFTQEQKTESLRKALIEAGYDMASSQAESMEEDYRFHGTAGIGLLSKTDPKLFKKSAAKGTKSSFVSARPDF